MKAELDDLEKDFSEHNLDKLAGRNFEISSTKSIDGKFTDFEEALENNAIPAGQEMELLGPDSRKMSTLSVPDNLFPE